MIVNSIFKVISSQITLVDRETVTLVEMLTRHYLYQIEQVNTTVNIIDKLRGCRHGSSDRMQVQSRIQHLSITTTKGQTEIVCHLIARNKITTFL
jgi:hypothetical protein